MSYSRILFAAAVIAVTTLAARSQAQCSGGRCAPRPSVGAVKLNQQANTAAIYQLRAQAVESATAARIANGRLNIATLLGRLKASGELRQAEAEYAETCVATAQRKHAAKQALAAENAEHSVWEWAQVKARNDKRHAAALARVQQARQGDWPAALLDAHFAALRSELTMALDEGRYNVARSPQFNAEYARSVAGQMREELRQRILTIPAADYPPAMRFLDDLQFLKSERQGPTL